MKKTITRLGTLLLLLALLCGIFAGCAPATEPSNGSETPAPSSEESTEPVSSNTGLDVEGGTDVYANYEASGKVTVAINKSRSTDFQALLDTFAQYYQNIDLEVDYFSAEGGTTEYLTAKAANGTLPDIVFDDYSSLPYFISQGWVYPLDDFVEGDGDFDYVPDSIVDSYTFNGHLFALPTTIHFRTIFLNLDLLNELNLDLPALDWTPEQYAELMKAATNATYSGSETVFDLDINLAGTTNVNSGYYGYDIANRRFNLAESWVENVQFMRGLREYPGLEAWSMRWNSSSDGTSDYVKKFGQGNTDDLHMAMKAGKTLSDTIEGTWDAWLYELKFNWTHWPYPQGADSKGRLPMHIDHSFMTTAVTEDNVEAAFEVLRYLTYGVEGNITRLSMFDEENAGKYVLNNRYYIPCTIHPDVAEKFESLPEVNEAIIYMYENIENSFRADPAKIVPDFDQINNDYILPSRNNVTDGLADAATVAAEVEAKANEEIAKKWAAFDETVEKFLADFKKVN